MSVSGYTVKSSSSPAGTSPATSSSHQPPTKTLKSELAGFEDAHSDFSSTKPLVESTDEELPEQVVQPVPNVPGDAHVDVKEEEGEEHDANAFVPNQDRNATLEEQVLEVPPLPQCPAQEKTEVFEIGTEDAEEKAEGDERLEEVKQEVEQKPPTSCSTDLVGPQPYSTTQPVI